MKKYSLVFIFNRELSKVLLVRKKSPEWQKGKLNGVGGKFETGEDGLACIVREVFEETGVAILLEEYKYLGVMGNESWRVSVYAVQIEEELDFTQGVEEVVWCDTKNLPDNTIGNLSWLIPLAVDKLRHNEISGFEVKYA